MNGKLWTDQEKEALRRLFPHQSTVKLSRLMGRSESSLNGIAYGLGLHKTPEYLASPEACRLRRGENPGIPHRFKPGHIPANKGLKQPGLAIGRMAETQFKKGTRQGRANLNWKPIGTIIKNTDGYLRIKVADEPESIAGAGSKSTNWEFIHKRVWEAAHGPIPPGHRLWWKDGNHDNCALENLELLSDAQHMARTSIHKLPRELKETILLVGRVKRAIRKRTKKDASEKQA